MRLQLDVGRVPGDAAPAAMDEGERCIENLAFSGNAVLHLDPGDSAHLAV